MKIPSIVSRFVNPQVIRYLAVGSIGFLVDAGGMETFILLDVKVHIARAMSMLMAIASTYLLHRYFTFKGAAAPKSAGGQFTAFGAVQLAAAILNYAIFSRTLYALPEPIAVSALGRLFALSLGVGAGLCFNYLLLNKIVFRAQTATDGKTPNPESRIDTSPRLVKRGLLWLLVAVIMLNSARGHYRDVLRMPNIGREMLPGDPDVWMRLAQVRDWMTNATGGGFFDHTVNKTDAPYNDIISAWTRPLDAILLMLYKLMPDGLAVNTKLMLAATWLPPLLGFIAFALLTKAASRHFNWLHTAGITAILLLFNSITYSYYVPGNSDHHGLLTTLWCGALIFMMKPLTNLAGAGLGMVLGVIIWISPEGLMPLAVAFGVLGIEALMKPERIKPLVCATLAVALTVTAALFVEMPADQILSRLVYDSVSIVHAVLLWLMAASAFLLSLVFPKIHSIQKRAVASGIVAVAALLCMAGIYPKFFLGPRVDMDPYIFQSFLPRITETMPLFSSGWVGVVNELAPVVLAAALLAIQLLRGKRPERRRRALILSAMLGATFIMTCLQVRCGYYMQPVAILSVAMGLPVVMGAAKPVYLRWTRAMPRNWRPYLALWVVFMVSVGLTKLKPYEKHENAYCMTQIRYAIHTGQVERLIGKKPTTLFTHEDSGGDVIFFTPYSVIAGNYHREGPGMRAIRDITYAKTIPEAREMLKERKVGAMMFCPKRYRENSWIRQAHDAGDKYPRWMMPVKGLRFMDMPGPKPLLFKVKP